MNAALVTLVLSCMATLILYGTFTLVVVVCHDRGVDPHRWRWAEVARYCSRMNDTYTELQYNKE